MQLDSEHSAFFRKIGQIRTFFRTISGQRERKMGETEAMKPFLCCFFVREQKRLQGSKELL